MDEVRLKLTNGAPLLEPVNDTSRYMKASEHAALPVYCSTEVGNYTAYDFVHAATGRTVHLDADLLLDTARQSFQGTFPD